MHKFRRLQIILFFLCTKRLVLTFLAAFLLSSFCYLIKVSYPITSFNKHPEIYTESYIFFNGTLMCHRQAKEGLADRKKIYIYILEIHIYAKTCRTQCTRSVRWVLYYVDLQIYILLNVMHIWALYSLHFWPLILINVPVQAGSGACSPAELH